MTGARVVKDFLIGFGDSSMVLPRNSCPLSVVYNDGNVYMVTLIDPLEPNLEYRKFKCVTTGSYIYSGLVQYLGTVFDPGGVSWHVFEVE